MKLSTKLSTLLIILLITYSQSAKADDGVVITELSGGVKVEEDLKAGTKTFIYPDGSRKSLSLIGKTPYGESIPKERRGIQGSPVPVYLNYDPERSDDILADEVKLLFEELYSSLRTKVIATRYNGEKALDLNFYYLRFCRTGFGYGKKPSVNVEFFQDGKVLNSFVFDPLSLKTKDERAKIISAILEYFQSLYVL